MSVNEEYLKLIHKLSAQTVEQLGLIRIKIHEKLDPLESLNFISNVLTAALALAVELQVEEMKGETQLDPKAEEKIVMVKDKLGKTIQEAMAELAPGQVVIRRREETDGESPGA